MIKKKLRLNTVLALKKDLEERIKQTEENIVRYNTTDTKIDSLIERLDMLSEQLERVKESLHSANRLKHSITGKSNNYYIYRLDSLTKRKRLYGARLTNAIRNSKRAQSSVTEAFGS